MSALWPGIAHQISIRYGLDSVATPLIGGHDPWAASWRLDSDRGSLVVRADRAISLATASWLSEVERRAAEIGIPCRPPLPARDGTTAFRASNATVTLRAFAVGTELDRDDPVQVREAGAVLARLHHAGRGTLVPRPEPSPWDAALWPGTDDPPALRDPELDAWHELFESRRWLYRGVVHGDFWAGNIICAARRVSAVIDFSESRLDVLARELAWSTWEFGHEDHYQLNVERARTFLAGYHEVQGPWEPHLSDVLIPLMRIELRRNARYSLANPRDTEYNRALQREFERLRGLSASQMLQP
jgi:Ser/Thr protein kinase RdoA (MazF antagonist)